MVTRQGRGGDSTAEPDEEVAALDQLSPGQGSGRKRSEHQASEEAGNSLREPMPATETTHTAQYLKRNRAAGPGTRERNRAAGERGG